MNTEIALYEDDSIIYSSFDKVEKVIDNIQTHLDDVQKWALSWKIVLNPSNNSEFSSHYADPKTTIL